MKKKTGERTKTGTKVFRAVYAALTALLAGTIIIGLTLLWNALSAYEKSDPEIPIKALMEQFKKEKSLLIKSLNAKLNEFEDESVLEAYFDKLTQGKITYSRNGKKSTEDRIVYGIKADGGTIAEAEVLKTKISLGYGFYEYELGEITFGEIPTHTYSVTAPDSARVFCNGIMISSGYVTVEGEIYPESEHFRGFLKAPPRDLTYTVGGFVGEAEFTAYDGQGNGLVLTDGVFSLAQKEDTELSELALNFAQSYSKYVVNDGHLSTAAEFLAPNMPFYAELKGYENFWHNWHTDYAFLDTQVGEPIFYDENCVSVKVKYDHVLYGVSSSENGELHSPADYTVYLVKIGEKWKVTELTLN